MSASESAMIQSPNYPDRYPYNADCVWRFPIPANKSVLLSFPQFSLAGMHSVKVAGLTETEHKKGNETIKNTTMSFLGPK